MTFAFLHPEFFVWMVPPVAVLFYFWQTQRPYETRWIGEKMLEKLRAPLNTMGLRGRNALFLAAALLLIGAMAQPVLVEEDALMTTPAALLVAVEIANPDPAAARETLRRAEGLLGVLAGEEIELWAFDERVYRVAPATTDTFLLSHLVRHLPLASRDGDTETVRLKARAKHFDAVFVVSEGFGDPEENVRHLGSEKDLVAAREMMAEIREAHELKHHVPLFYYPLGLAMVLIGIALSSMSPRRSVSVGMALLLVSFATPQARAGLFDFELLGEAKAAYEAGHYAKSAELFARYQRLHDSPEVRYNRANALYLAGYYAQAQFWYTRVHTRDPILEERRRFNLEQTRKRLGGGETKRESKGPDVQGKSSGADRAMAKPSPFRTPLYPL